jgi:hypothetical protein
MTDRLTLTRACRGTRDFKFASASLFRAIRGTPRPARRRPNRRLILTREEPRAPKGAKRGQPPLASIEGPF